MKRWQVYVIVVLLAAAAWAVASFPPGSRVVRSISVIVPSPTPRPVPRNAAPVKLLFTGDIMLSRSVGATIVASGDWRWPFEKIASVTSAADITFGNLETTISERGVKGGCGFCFRSDPRVIQGLTAAGFDVLSVANNHIWDYGRVAFTDTLGYLESVGIGPVGGNTDETRARAGIIREVRGTRIAYLGYTDLLGSSTMAGPDRPGINVYDAERMKADVTAAKALADVVVVSFHTGTEYELLHNAHQEMIYHAIIDAGADLVVGTHPHVIQDIERYNGKWIAYSLGNFVFDQNFSLPTRQGMMLSVTVIGGKISDVAQIPVDISKQYQVFVHDPGNSI